MNLHVTFETGDKNWPASIVLSVRIDLAIWRYEGYFFPDPSRPDFGSCVTGDYSAARSLAGWRPSTRHATRGPPLRLSVTRGLGGGPLFTFLAVVGCGSRAQPMPAGWQPCRRVRLDGHSSQVESSFPSDSEAAPPAVESIGRVDATTIISACQRRCLWGAAGPLIPLAASGTSKLHLRVCKSVSRES